jgi:RNA ligase
MNPNKPLGKPAYGSIPHLPGSRLGPGDHHISEGQAIIATERRRDKYDKIYVQEKLDGSNVSIANINGKIYPLTRKGYIANTSQFEQHHMFYDFIMNFQSLFNSLLNDGERLCGEWIAQAHGTKYELNHSPFNRFIAFDIIDQNRRFTYSEFIERIGLSIPSPRTMVYEDFAPISIHFANGYFGEYGFHGALDPIEGYIWRVERKGEVDFITKYVRPDKVDGIYLPENNGGEIVWNK